MVRRSGNVVNNPPPEEGAITSQKIDEILATFLGTRDHLAVLKQQVIGNEEKEDASNNNQPTLEDNANLGVYNNNVNIPDQPEKKKARLEVERTNDIKRISLPKFDGTTLGDGAKNFIRRNG
ncbi:hypothetical protein KI387_013467 [Taxus chinensis]|uniref:Uncharacterized protein n=1 Tax=Taxus chinensis TaxID=29808 RepID=A0AA38FD95_TAXCH|nr:hypothetical protein KI387_013467 [Taxus chinensis]